MPSATFTDGEFEIHCGTYDRDSFGCQITKGGRILRFSDGRYEGQDMDDLCMRVLANYRRQLEQDEQRQSTTFAVYARDSRTKEYLLLMDIARATGLSPAEISDIERGIKPPPEVGSEVLYNWATVLGVPTRHFNLLARDALREWTAPQT